MCSVQYILLTLFNASKLSTTVFGVDETSRFDDSSDNLLDAQSLKPIPPSRYKTCKPRPMPQCLDQLRKVTEKFTCVTYNFCLVNYYSNGSDSISYHSDDERFLEKEPAIASLSLGAPREFLMKHKTTPAPVDASSTQTKISLEKDNKSRRRKFSLASGDMLLMRGPTQANWLHSVPKTTNVKGGGLADKGRINITFRKALVTSGTENYYCYNVGRGEVMKWDERKQEMAIWTGIGDEKAAAP